MTDNTSASKPLPPVTVESSRHGFKLTCPQLGVTCTASTLEAGYATLQELAADATRDDTALVGAIPTMDVRGGKKSSRPRRGEKSSTLFRFAIAASLLPVVVMTLSILNDVRAIVRDLREFTLSTSNFADDMPRLARLGSIGLARLAETVDKLTPERQEEMRINLEKISLKLAPAAQGLRPLFEAVGMVPSTAARPSAVPEDSAPTSRSQDSEAK